MDKSEIEALIGTLDNWAAFFTLLVVLGVGGEFVVHIMSSRASKRLIGMQQEEERAREREIALLRKDAAEAGKGVAEANAQAKSAIAAAEEAKLKQREVERANTEMQLKVEKERTARLALEAKLADRQITVQQKEQIAGALKPFAGQQVSIEAMNGERESNAFAQQLEDCFEAAGLHVGLTFPIILRDPKAPPFAPVSLRIGAAREDLANAIANLLIETGFAEKPIPAERVNDANTLVIFIGQKKAIQTTK